MHKWEYTFVVAEPYGAYGEEVWRPRWVNGEELPDWKKGEGLQKFCNRLGSEGWEMVQIGPGGDRGYTLGATSMAGVSPLPLIFKRELEG
ncbi:MAG TPA: hypothetical protein VF960_11640 [Chloroflexota bacterium]